MINDPNLSALLRIASALERIADALGQKKLERPKSAPVTLACATLEDRILAALRRGPMSARDMQRSFFRAVDTAENLRSFLASMVKSGTVVAITRKAKNGQSVVFYSLPARGKGSASH